MLYPAEVVRVYINGEHRGFALKHPRPFAPAQTLDVWVAGSFPDLEQMERDAKMTCDAFNALLYGDDLLPPQIDQTIDPEAAKLPLFSVVDGGKS